ncbi:MAG: hypothetical protein LUQ69_10405, partial [Methanoregulaceae archaeon]|nr:hypothetical protein [Methanoregulaceae archaeon]
PGLKKEIASALFKGPPALSCAPNPFAPESRVAFSISGASGITLAVYAPDGRLVRKLAHGRFEAGTHYAVWDGRNAQGRPVSAGVYCYRLEAGKETRIIKALLAR